MAHMIDESNNRANIAYAGEVPWHGLGHQLTPDAPIEVWAVEAGLTHEVRRSAVKFATESADAAYDLRAFDNRNVLYRGDTLAPLGIVSDDYNIVQPAEVLGFFRKLVEHNSAKLEVAGSLEGGRRIWALARLNDGAPVIDTDIVRPLVLLATSYDGSMSTTLKFTSIRVVCNNTMVASVGGYNPATGQAQRGEYEKAGSAIRIPHSAVFDPDDARIDLGIYFNEWERFLASARKLARVAVDKKFAVEFLRRLLPAPTPAPGKDGVAILRPLEETRAFQSIMALFNGNAVGGELVEARGTAWGLLNAVTEYVDHDRGNNATRLNSAWFGSGAGLKAKAAGLLEAVAA